jgi:hypothetical protein
MQVCKYVHSFLSRSIPESLGNIFTLSQNTHVYGTRHSKSMKLLPPKFQQSLACHNIMKKGPELWNILPDHLYLRPDQSLYSTSAFSVRFARHVLGAYGDGG